MAVVRAFMSKLLMPRMPVLKTMQWRITSVRYSSSPGLSSGRGPQINFRPEGDAVTDEDREQNGVNTSNSISINEDEASGPGLSTGSGPQTNFRPEGDAVTDEDREQNGVNTSNSISINEDEASRPGLSTGSGPQINFLPQGDAVTDEDQEQNGVNTTSNNISIN